MNRWTGLPHLGCFLRSHFVGAAYNPQGLQNIGFLYALDPALRALYPDQNDLRTARLRHARWFNCHPFFIPMLLGMTLHMETAIAAGQLAPMLLSSLRETTANTLSAIGDSFFNGTMLGTWALGSACLVIAGYPGTVLFLSLSLLMLLHIFKALTFIVGLRGGMTVLALIKKLDLANWSVRLKYGNAAIAGCFVWLAMPDSSPAEWILAAGMLLAASWIVGRLHISRIFVALVFFTLIAATQWFGIYAPDFKTFSDHISCSTFF